MIGFMTPKTGGWETRLKCLPPIREGWNRNLALVGYRQMTRIAEICAARYYDPGICSIFKELLQL